MSPEMKPVHFEGYKSGYVVKWKSQKQKLMGI